MGLTGSLDRTLREHAGHFSPDAHILRVKGFNLYSDHLTHRTVINHLRDHIAQHGTLDELIISTHGISANLSHLGGVERFLEQVHGLQREAGKKVAHRIVFTACQGFSFRHSADQKVEAIKSLARSLDAEVAGATTTVFHTLGKNPHGPSIYGRFVKFTPDGRIERDVLDTSIEVVKQHVAASRKVAKRFLDIVSWPSRAQRQAARATTNLTEYYEAMGWNVEDLAHRALSKSGYQVIDEVGDEAAWVAKHLNASTAREAASAAAPASPGLTRTIQQTTQHAPGIGSWGPYALIGGIGCVVAAWLAFKPKDHARRLADPVQQQGIERA